ncbi:hypothetical protein V8F06_011835 [Rhypophila decipiens]
MPPSSTPASRNACVACTLAKRACDRHVPRCGRCVDRLLECQYYGKFRLDGTLVGRTRNRPTLLAPRPTHTQLPQANTTPDTGIPESESIQCEPESFFDPTDSLLAPPVVFPTCPDMPFLESPNSLPSIDWPNTHSIQIPPSIFIPTPHCNLNATPPNMLSEQGWFLHPDSWKVKRTYVPSLAGDPHSIFRAFVKSVKAWLGDFATTGHNIFIHRHLYHSQRVRGGMPTCLQDAWLTITAYLAKTDQTEELILQILDDRADRLLSKQHFINLPPEELDIRAQLARTQALLIHTFIRLLYDNPPEQRTKALSSLPVLSAWCYSLSDAAIAQAPSLYMSSNSSLINLDSCSGTHQEIEQTSLWHAFIVSESIRRTWMLVSSVLRIFNQPQPPTSGVDSMNLTTVTQHRCLGFLSFTIRAGLWDAQNAFQWGRLHSSRASYRKEGHPNDHTLYQPSGSSQAAWTDEGDRVPSDGKLWSESKRTIITTFIQDRGLGPNMDGSNIVHCAGDQILYNAEAASMSVTPVFLESVGILDKILDETTPEDVDSWTNQILRMVLPSERIDRWASKMRNVGSQASFGSSS